MIEKFVVRKEDNMKDVFDWGELQWMNRKELTGTDALTVGTCTIRPGKANMKHVHNTTEENLLLLSGKIIHTLGDEQVELNPGDLIRIPPGVSHQAFNIGDEDAVALILYNTGSRDTVPVK